MSGEIKQCPACGCKAEYEYDSITLGCESCYLQIINFDEELAIMQWNNQPRIDELEKKLKESEVKNQELINMRENDINDALVKENARLKKIIINACSFLLTEQVIENSDYLPKKFRSWVLKDLEDHNDKLRRYAVRMKQGLEQ